jgi:hypothetical protein
MKKEGAILLGIGGDNSVSGRGTFQGRVAVPLGRAAFLSAAG